MFRAKSALLVVVARWSMLILLLPALAGLPVPSFAQSGQDFAFAFSINGYHAGKWFEDPAALTLDERAGLVYVADQKAGMIDAFSLQGIAKFQYGGSSGLKAPIGLAVNRNGDICASENDGGPIRVLDARGKVSTSVEIPADAEKEQPKPGRMKFDSDGNLYVVDRANSRICVFDKNRVFKFAFGKSGDDRGEFKLPQDVAVDRQGRIYVLDSIGFPVQVFDRKGGYLYRFGTRGEGQRDLSFPSAITVDRNDQIWVVDRTQHSLKVFDRSGAFLTSFGSYGQGEGALFYPIDVVISDLGRVYVLEAGARSEPPTGSRACARRSRAGLQSTKPMTPWTWTRSGCPLPISASTCG